MTCSAPEPEHIAQAAVADMPSRDPFLWVRARQSEMGRDGATWFRVSWTTIWAPWPRLRRMVLIEGWNERPESQGKPRWQAVEGWTP